MESSKRTDQFEKAWDRFSYITYHQLAAEDGEADEDLSNEWESDSCQYQYSDVDPEELDEGIMEDEVIMEDEDINSYWLGL